MPKETSELSERGRKSRAKGQKFEAKVREELEALGWVVSKWMNTVDYDKLGNMGKLVPAKRKYNPFSKVLSIGTGFPDFICFRRVKNQTNEETIEGTVIPESKKIDKNDERFDVIGVEAKGNGYLDKIEKGMCIWLLQNKIFSRILIARKAKERGKIEYTDFEEKYNKLKSS
jgi:hypothetical protein